MSKIQMTKTRKNPKTLPPEAIFKNFYDDSYTVGNYKKTFENCVSDLLKTQPPIEDRKKAAEALCEAYFDQTEDVPDGVQLQRLANWLLLEDLIDPHPDKVTRADYPIMSKRQLKLRYWRELADERIENRSLNDKKRV